MSSVQKISVGVAAWDKEANLVEALQSITDQTIFQNAGKLGVDIELVVLSSSDTQTVTGEFLGRTSLAFVEGGPVRLRREEVPSRSFSKVWNLLVHTCGRKDSDYIFFVNSGVVIDQSNTFECMLHTINKDYDMKLLSPKRCKQFGPNVKMTLVDRLNLAVTNFSDQSQPRQARVQCFCVRSKAVRKVWLPEQFPGAVDSLLRKLIASDMVSAPDHSARIGVTDEVSCTCVADRSLTELLSCRLKQVVGHMFAEILTDHLRQMLSDRPDSNLMNYLKARDNADAAWLDRLVQLKIHENGLMNTLPSLWFRFRFLKNHRLSWFEKTKMFPVAVVAFIFDVPVYFVAATRLKNGRVSSAWKTPAEDPDRAMRVSA